MRPRILKDPLEHCVVSPNILSKECIFSSRGMFQISTHGACSIPHSYQLFISIFIRPGKRNHAFAMVVLNLSVSVSARDGFNLAC